MYSYDEQLRKFYKAEVAIDAETRKKLHDARVANQSRLEDGLANEGSPKVKRHVQQGGYAMKTVVQQPKNAYDIDNGAVFAIDSLRGPKGGLMSSLDARTMVCDALQDKRFKRKPEVRPHCVRVYYDEGWWVDVPVYRELIDAQTKLPRLELASTDWKPSNPQGVTAWFELLVKSKSPDAKDPGDPQFRRVVAYIKGLAKCRATWDWPTGFMVSVLVSECYVSDSRDDVALRSTLQNIHARLKRSLLIAHPVMKGEKLSKGAEDARCIEMRDKLGELLEKLKVLDESKCSSDDAARAWDGVYGTTYFKSLRENDNSKGGAPMSFTTTGTASSPFQRGDGGKYG